MLNRIYDTIPYYNETLYRCNRVWEAWNYWTMTRDDFEEVEPYIMIGDVLDWAEKTICKKRSICCPLCWNKIEIEEDEIWDFWRIYQKWYFACVDNECGFYTTNSSWKNNSQYECEWEKKNIERDFCVPEYFSRPISDKIYGDIADTAYADQNESIDIYWKDKRKPIQDQPIECIEYIYNLLP